MTNKLVTTVQGSAATPYEIRETTDSNVLWCSCPAWRNSKLAPKTCKHIMSLDGDRSAPAPAPEVVRALTVAGQKPMRMDSVDPADAQVLFESDDWVVEQKVDGTRCIITVTPNTVTFTASNGETLRHSASLIHVANLKRSLPVGNYVLDGELLWTGVFWAFDLLDQPSETLQARRIALEALAEELEFGSRIRLLPQARGLEDKLTLFKRVYAQGGEGVILKHIGKKYEYGKRVVHQLKLKFTKTVDCIVTARNVNGKNNARLAVYEDGVLRDIGGCSMIGKPDAQVGDVVEVKYLYATEDLDIYQPTLLKIRTDKAASDCLLDQLTPVSKEVLSDYA